MQQLSFTIPYTSSAIRATVTALNQMDNDLNGSVGLFVPPTVAHGCYTTVGTVFDQSAVEFEEVRQPDYFQPSHEVPVSAFTPPPPSDEDADLADVQPEGAVDSAGMQWDERIHSSSKAFLKSDGTWKLKKGVDKTLLAQVQAELMGNVPDTSPTQSNVITPLPQVEAIVDSTPPPPSATPVASTPPPPSATPVASTDVPNPNAFRQLLSEITKAGLAPDYVQKTCMEVNGRALPLCKDDMGALDTLRMALGL